MKGGEFLIKDQEASSLFIPEQFSEEQKMFRQMAKDFIDTKIKPIVAKIDKQLDNPDLIPNLMDEAGELGLLGASMPEEYGGMGIDFNSETIITEELGQSHSFGVAIAAHTGIGTLPILYFGTEEQKKKYLPGLISGKIKASYALTEPDSGSDALAAKTRAVLSADGKHYIINGQKMWITNAGFADLFTVFAKIDGEHFTGFLIDANTPGITLGDEEVKLGIKGSSTRQVFFEDVKVPVENLLGEIGKGHKIAFNVLNIGRYKLGAMVMGGCKGAIDTSISYANERKQFGKPISSFGAIRHKIAEMAIKTYANESFTYRLSELLNSEINRLVETGLDKAQAKLKAAEEYNIECALLKVYASEVLDFVVDEAVQIFGGTGYSEEYPVARYYRDSRINRIFEGTNEINRMLAVGQVLKKALKGQLDLMGPAMAIQDELMSIPDFSEPDPKEYFFYEMKAIKNAKKAILMVAGAAAQKFMLELEKQQEILMNVADMAIELFAMESTVLRTQKLIEIKGKEAADLQIKMTKVMVQNSVERIGLAGKHALAGFAEDDELRMMLLGIKRFTKYPVVNEIGLRKEIAKHIIAENKYPF